MNRVPPSPAGLWQGFSETVGERPRARSWCGGQLRSWALGPSSALSSLGREGMASDHEIPPRIDTGVSRMPLLSVLQK